MTLNQQVNKFRSMISTWSDDYIEKSLFMIYIGTEDYSNFTKFNPTASASAQQASVTSVTNKLKTDVGVSCRYKQIICGLLYILYIHLAHYIVYVIHFTVVILLGS